MHYVRQDPDESDINTEKIDVEKAAFVAIPDSNSIERDILWITARTIQKRELRTAKSHAVGSMYKVYVIMHALLVPHT